MTDSVTYDAVLDVRRETVLFLSGLLAAERERVGTRAGRRAMGCFKQAVMVSRWFLDGTRVAQLARDNAIGGSTAYRYVHECIDVLAARSGQNVERQAASEIEAARSHWQPQEEK